MILGDTAIEQGATVTNTYLLVGLGLIIAGIACAIIGVIIWIIRTGVREGIKDAQRRR